MGGRDGESPCPGIVKASSNFRSPEICEFPSTSGSGGERMDWMLVRWDEMVPGEGSLADPDKLGINAGLS